MPASAVDLTVSWRLRVAIIGQPLRLLSRAQDALSDEIRRSFESKDTFYGISVAPLFGIG
jgi:hypothetical protein